jgi:hypothetical protein
MTETNSSENPAVRPRWDAFEIKKYPPSIALLSLLAGLASMCFWATSSLDTWRDVALRAPIAGLAIAAYLCMPAGIRAARFGGNFVSYALPLVFMVIGAAMLRFGVTPDPAVNALIVSTVMFAVFTLWRRACPPSAAFVLAH